MRTSVYIDGFNLYYRALKNTPYRWLDVARMCQLILPRYEIDRILYFTARITPLPRDPDQPVRQQVYLRALSTSPNLTIVYGHFLSHTVRMPLADGSGFADVIRAEEKGSDVALATLLVHDAHRDAYDTAVVVSNDTDLVTPIRVAREEVGKRVGVICPHRFPSKGLLDVADFVRPIRPGVLRASQFPGTLCDASGDFQKPASW